MTIPPSGLMIVGTKLTILMHFVPFLKSPPSDEAEYDDAAQATAVCRRDCLVKEGYEYKQKHDNSLELT